jgi:hypothetical protein
MIRFLSPAATVRDFLTKELTANLRQDRYAHLHSLSGYAATSTNDTRFLNHVQRRD